MTSYDQLPDFKALFESDFDNGKLFWKPGYGPNGKKGSEAGYFRDRRGGKGKKPKLYCMVQVGGNNNYNRGKILYYLAYGVWCPTIDHINGDSTDDRLNNLREISLSKNEWSAKKKNKYGFTGVHKDTKTNKFRAVVTLFGTVKWLSLRKSPKEASQDYLDFYKNFYGQDLTVDYYTEVQQGTPLWHHLRKNRVTGTSSYKLLEGMSIEDIIKETENVSTFSGNQYTERGKILESENRKLYEEINQTTVYEVGGIINSKYPRFYYSPDGCVGLDGLIECKSFLENHHEDAMENLDFHVISQIQFGLFVSERKWCDLCLYNPEITDIKKAFWVKRFFPDEEIFAKFRQALTQTVDDSKVQEKALQIINLETELQQVPEEIKAQILDYQAKRAKIQELKNWLKTNSQGKIKKVYEDDSGNKLDISIYDTNRVSVSDESQVPEEYTTTVQVENVFQGNNGNFYQRIPNPKLAGSMYKAGKSLPPGFKVSTSRSISIKFNGEVL